MAHLRPGPARGGGRLRCGALAQHQQCGQRGEQEDRSGDQHRRRHELCRALPPILRPADVSQARAERHEPADVAERPAPARHATERTWPGDLGQKGGDQVFAGAEKEIRHDQQRNGEHQRAGTGEPERRRGRDAAQRGDRQQLLLAGVRIGPGAHQRRGRQHRRVGRGQRERPGEGRPGRVARDHRNEIRAEHRRDDDRGVARVGEVVHRPGPQLVLLHAGLENARGAHVVSASACCCSAHMWA